MKIKHVLISLPFAVSLLLIGCGNTTQAPPVTYSYVTSKQAPVNAIDKNAQAQLAEAAVAVGRSLNQLSALKMAIHPHAKMPAPLNAQAIGMTQISSVNWTGPLLPLLKKIASASGYTLNVIGHPATPVIVTLSESNVPLASILHDAVLQASTRTTITVYPNKKTIQLLYNTQ